MWLVVTPRHSAVETGKREEERQTDRVREKGKKNLLASARNMQQVQVAREQDVPQLDKSSLYWLPGASPEN